MTDKTQETTEAVETESVNQEVEKNTDSSDTTVANGKPDAKKDGVKTSNTVKTPGPDANEGTLFDMRSKEEIAEEKRLANMNENQRKAEKSRKEAEDKRKEAEKKKKEEQNRIYEEGTKLRYVGHLSRENRELDRPMDKKQIIEDLQDDYPEVTAERAKFRYDKDKKQIVVTMGSFDKGVF